MQRPDYDLLILGAGSAGFWAAKTAAQAGARVALVDPGPLGGLCILKGCMPSKALLRSGDILHTLRHAPEVGVYADNIRYDFKQIMARKSRWVDDFAGYRRDAILKQEGFRYIEGAGHFIDPHTVKVGEETLRAEKFLVATGSKPSIPPITGLKEAGFITSDQALSLEAVPESMVVIGGGVIALELGQFYARLGTSVTMVLRCDRPLGQEDPDVSEAIQGYLQAEGIRFVPNARIQDARLNGTQKQLRVMTDTGEQILEASEILVATGRAPNLDGLNLSAANLSTSDGRLATNQHGQTHQSHIYAAGDAAGRHNIVHVAIQEGIHAARHALGLPGTPPETRTLAWAIFCDPNIARVGLNERSCQVQGIPHVVGRYPFNDQGKALVANLIKGFVKVVAHAATGEILGATVVGAEGADLIHEMIVAMHFKATLKDFLEIPHLHPTLSEIWLEPVEEAEQKRAALAVEA
jgi:pyruvate/2-oxoglutarate dehydrogenase complex dihydrolipoamide dehydrogenase (E3) component